MPERGHPSCACFDCSAILVGTTVTLGSVSNPSTSGFTFAYTPTNDNPGSSNAYYLLLASNAGAPDAAAVLAGTGAVGTCTGAVVVNSGSSYGVVCATLVAGVTYDLYLASDSDGSGGLVTVATSGNPQSVVIPGTL
jgi:hypothetical protein